MTFNIAINAFFKPFNVVGNRHIVDLLRVWKM